MKFLLSRSLTLARARTPKPPVAAELQAPWRVAFWAACLGIVSALIVFAPAAWLALAVSAATNGQVLLGNAQGSLWRGSAQLLLTGGSSSQDAASLPGRVDWTLLPTLSGARMALNLPCCAANPVQLVLKPGFSQSAIEVLPAKMFLPAQWLSGLGAPWNTLDPQGQLAISNNEVLVQWSAGRLRLQGQLNLELLGFSSRLSTLSPLGDYRLVLNGGDVPTMNLQTLQGALQLSGSGQVVGSRVRFRGEATAAPDQLDVLSNVLNIIGRRTGSKSLISLG